MLEELWNTKCFDGYGRLEFQPVAWNCVAQSSPHLVENFAHAEVLDVETAKPVPDGTPEILVLTHLDKQAMPLVRWWTGDVVVRDCGPCRAGARTRGLSAAPAPRTKPNEFRGQWLACPASLGLFQAPHVSDHLEHVVEAHSASSE